MKKYVVATVFLVVFLFVGTAHAATGFVVSINADGKTGSETVPYGNNATITWSSTNAFQCTLGGNGTNNLNSSVNGSATIGPLTASKYTIDFNCISYNPAYATKKASVTVNVSSRPSTALPVAAPAITVLSPNGGEVYRIGDTVNIHWSTSNYASPNVALYLSQGVTDPGFQLITQSTPNNGNYSWTIPNIGIPYTSTTKIFKIVAVASTNNLFPIDSSDNYFSINAQQTASLVCTNLTKDLEIGSVSNDVVLLQNFLSAEGYFTNVSTGLFSSLTGQAVSAFRVANGLSAGTSIGPATRAAITLVSGCTPTTGTTPSLTVTSPNGGETWDATTQHTITWTTNVAGTSEIYLQNQSGAMCHMGTSGINGPQAAGPQVFYTILASQGCGSGSDFQITSGQYKIAVFVNKPGETSSIGTAHDVSDNFFTIDMSSGQQSSPTVAFSLDASNPNAGSTYVDQNVGAQNIPVLVFNAQASANINITGITVTPTVNNAVGAGGVPASSATLLQGGTPIASIALNGTSPVTFNHLNAAVASGTTQPFVLEVTVPSFSAGSTQVQLVVTSITYQTTTGQSVTVTPSITGNGQSFYTATPQLAFVSGTASAFGTNQSGYTIAANGQITFTVTPKGGLMVQPKASDFTILVGTSLNTAVQVPVASTSIISITPTPSGASFPLSQGQTYTIIVSATANGVGANSLLPVTGTYQFYIGDIATTIANPNGVPVTTISTSPQLTNFKTGSVAVTESGANGSIGQNGCPTGAVYNTLTGASCTPATTPTITLTQTVIGKKQSGTLSFYEVDLTAAGGTVSRPVKMWTLNFACPSTSVDMSAKGGGGCGNYQEGTITDNGNIDTQPFDFENSSATTQAIPVTAIAYDASGAAIGTASLTISVPSTQTTPLSFSQVTLLGPNGGNNLTFAAGQNITVRWTAISGSPFNFSPTSRTDIQLLNGNVVVADSDNLPNRSTAAFTIPTAVPAGSNYKISVTVYADGFTGTAFAGSAQQDESDTPFTITSTASSTNGCVPGAVYSTTTGVLCSSNGNTNTTQNYTPISVQIITGTQATTLTPTIAGIAAGVSQVGVVLSNNGGKVYGSGLISVVNGTWTVTVSPALAAGMYTTTIYDANNKILATGSLNVIAPVTAAQPTVTVTANGHTGSDTIAYNGVDTITWSAMNATSCSAPWGSSLGMTGSYGTPNLTTTTTYSVLCQSAGGYGVGTVTINVQPKTATTATNHTPTGSLDYNNLNGWAGDVDAPTQALIVNLYIDSTATAGTPFSSVEATTPRSDVTASHPQFTGNHGFTFNIPTQYYDGKQHTLRAYAFDPQTNAQAELPGSPQVFTLAAPAASLPAPTLTCLPLTRDLSAGTTGSDVTALQNFLRVMGNYSGAPSGVYDAATGAAVNSFRASYVLGFDTSVNAATRARILLVSCSAPRANPVTCTNLTNDLSIGSTGTDVTNLQNFLTARHYYQSPVTGTFDAITGATINAFRYDNALPLGTGADAAVRSRIQSISCSTATATTDTGSRIAAIQSAIATLTAELAKLMQ